MRLLREGPAAPKKNLLPVFSDLDPGDNLSSWRKQGTSLGFWAGFWKKGALFEGRGRRARARLESFLLPLRTPCGLAEGCRSLGFPGCWRRLRSEGKHPKPLLSQHSHVWMPRAGLLGVCIFCADVAIWVNINPCGKAWPKIGWGWCSCCLSFWEPS